MNIHAYSQDIVRLKEAAKVLRNVAIRIGDEQNQMDNHGDIMAAQSDLGYLFLAAELVERTLPKSGPRLRPSAQLALNCLRRIPDPDEAERIVIKDLQAAIDNE